MDEFQNLVINVSGVPEVKALTVALKEQKQAVKEAIGTYEVMASVMDTVRDEMTESAVEATRAQKLIRQSLEDSGSAAVDASKDLDGLGKKARVSQQGILDMSRAVQDFAQGGLGGVLNNIEGITRGLGGTSGMAAAATVAGVAIWALKPAIESALNWGNAWFRGASETIPKATGFVDALKESLDKTVAAMKQMQEAQYLTNEGLEKYNKLAERKAAIEEEIRTEQAVGAVGENQDEESTRRKAAATKAIAEFGGGKKAVDALVAEDVPAATAKAMIADALKGGKEGFEYLKSLNAGDGAREAAGMPFDASPSARLGGLANQFDPERVEEEKAQEELNEADARRTERRLEKKKRDAENEEKRRQAVAEQVGKEDMQVNELARAQEAREAERKAREEAAQAKRDERERPRMQAAQAIQRRAEETGTDVNRNDVDAMVGPVLSMVSKGASVNDAILMAFNARMAEINRLNAQLQGQLARAQSMEGGNDGNGYSALSIGGGW